MALTEIKQLDSSTAARQCGGTQQGGIGCGGRRRFPHTQPPTSRRRYSTHQAPRVGSSRHLRAQECILQGTPPCKWPGRGGTAQQGTGQAVRGAHGARHFTLLGNKIPTICVVLEYNIPRCAGTHTWPRSHPARFPPPPSSHGGACLFPCNCRGWWGCGRRVARALSTCGSRRKCTQECTLVHVRFPTQMHARMHALPPRLLPHPRVTPLSHRWSG